MALTQLPHTCWLEHWHAALREVTILSYVTSSILLSACTQFQYPSHH